MRTLKYITLALLITLTMVGVVCDMVLHLPLVGTLYNMGITTLAYVPFLFLVVYVDTTTATPTTTRTMRGEHGLNKREITIIEDTLTMDWGTFDGDGEYVPRTYTDSTRLQHSLSHLYLVKE